jgi:glycosyltransferase involved in cell wall biosynthesis
LTLTEANACGAPAVASNVQGLRDAVIDGNTEQRKS